MFFDAPFLDAVAKGSLLSAFGLIWIILLVRIVGLRSFSKMTNFDFVMTVAMGSLLAGASQSEEWPALVQTLTAMASLLRCNIWLPVCDRNRRGSIKWCRYTPSC